MASDSFFSSSFSAYEPRNPGLLRIGTLGAYAFSSPNGDYENKDDKDTKSGSISLLAGIGRGLVSFETGVSYMHFSDIAERTDDDESAHRFLVQSQYVGFPLLMKLNYIEKPLNTFYFKLGAIPVTNVGQTKEDSVKVAGQSTLAVAGIGGTTDLSKSIAFVLDIAVMRNLGAELSGIPLLSSTLGLGLTYDF